MNNLTDEQIDKYIKEKLKKDKIISEKANSVFEYFNLDNTKRQEVKKMKDQNQNEKITDNVIQVNFYKKMNRILSVAAVSLTVVLIGGSAFYFDKNRNKNPDVQTETIVYNKSYLIQNDRMELSNEKITKEKEDEFVKVYLVDKKDVAIQLKDRYWNIYEGTFKSTECYKVENVNGDVSDIFIGEIGGSDVPYVFLLMEDGTIEYIDLNNLNNNTFYFSAEKIDGLYGVTGFEQKSRKFFYSDENYQYVNAIRNDGVRKEIELGEVNNWYDNSTNNYDKLNEKYIKAYSEQNFTDDKRINDGIKEKDITELSEFERRVYESGKYYYSSNGHYCIKNPREVNIAYYIENETLYRVIIPNNDSVASVATGVKDIRENNEYQLIVSLETNGSVFGNYEGNVVFKEFNVTESPVVSKYSNENMKVELKKDGSLAVLIYTGGLKRLGFNSENTRISENVYYNMYGSAHGVKNGNTQNYYASAKQGILANAGRNGRLCFVYEKSDGNVIAIDIKNAIECGSFTGARTSECYIEGTVKEFCITKFFDDKDDKGNLISPYDTIFVVEEIEKGKERQVHIYMPCEDE